MSIIMIYNIAFQYYYIVNCLYYRYPITMYIISNYILIYYALAINFRNIYVPISLNNVLITL